jgi:hypothetical protein
MNRSLQAPHISCTPISWDRICLGRCIRRAESNYECYFNASETNSAHLWSPISMSIDTHFRHHQATKGPLQGLSYDSTSQLPSNHIHYVRPPWHHAARYPENCQWASCHEGFYSCDILAHWEDVISLLSTHSGNNSLLGRNALSALGAAVIKSSSARVT